jgi:hypothetical protein
MAKVQGKKTAVLKRASRPVARLKSTVAKVASKKPAKPKVRAAKNAPKAVAKRAAAKSKQLKVVPKPALKVAPKPAAKPAAKPAPKSASKPVAKLVKVAAPAPKSAPKPAAALKPAPKVVAAPAKPVAVAKPVALPKPAPVAKAADKKARRPRTRVTSSGGPVANWLHNGEKPRPSSFMPAPPRAEAPSLVAAPPASSDRLIRDEDLAAPTVRTVPVRVDIEYAAGRCYVGVNPTEVVLRPGEGIEWDFRYLGGADVTVDEVIIEFDRPSPFTQQVFRCRKPGIGRPMRQHSAGVAAAASGKRVQYTIRAMTAFKTELGTSKPYVLIS